jgi:hypothetical protein
MKAGDHRLQMQLSVQKKVRIGTGQYFKKIEGSLPLKKKRIGINLIPVTVSQ